MAAKIEVGTRIEDLGPIGYGDFNSESLPDYLSRVRPLVPRYPDCVLEQWLHRHWTCVRSQWAWLGLPGLQFREETWPVERINTLPYSNKKNIDGWTEQFKTDPRFQSSYLGKYMLENGTWPAPIIVILNELGLKMPNGFPLSSPYDLLEGHHRLAYLRAMHESGVASLQGTHDIWIAEPDPSQVSEKWEPWK